MTAVAFVWCLVALLWLVFRQNDVWVVGCLILSYLSMILDQLRKNGGRT